MKSSAFNRAKIILTIIFIVLNNLSDASNVIRLVITNHINSDEAIILFNPLAGSGLNGWDSEKMMNSNNAIPEMYTKEGNTRLVINSLPEITNGMIIPIFIKIGQAGQHQLIPNLNQFDLITNLILEDLQTGVFHDLRNSAYRFHSLVTIEQFRFRLHLNPSFNVREKYYFTSNNGTAENTQNWNYMPDGSSNFAIDFLNPNANYYINTGKTANIQSSWSPKGKLLNEGIINIEAGQNISLDDSLINNGIINLKSNFVDGTATLIANYSSGSGIYNVEQALSGSVDQNSPNGRFWYISSPVANATSNVFNAASISNKLWTYNEPTFSYTEITNNSTPLIVAGGLVARMGSSGNIVFTGGTLNNGNISLSLSRTGITNDKRGYHLVGNPYPSFVNPTSTFQNTTNNLTPTIWYRTSNGAIMKFETFNYVNQTGTSGLTPFIPPMQGFWVQVNGDGNTGTFTLNNSMRTHQTNNLLKTNFSNNIARIFIDNGNNKDEAIILFNNSAGASFDDWDSEKMFNNNSIFSEIYTIEDDKKLVINSMPDLYNGMILPLFINIKTSGLNTINADLSEFDTSTQLYLLDLKNSTLHNLREKPYTFNSGIIDNYHRFNLMFSNEQTQTQNSNLSSITVFQNNQAVFINSNSAGIIEVYDLLGKKIIKQQLNTGLNEIHLFQKGIFIVRINTKNEIKTLRIFVD